MDLLGFDAAEEIVIMVSRSGQLSLQYHGITDPMVIARIAFALERGAAILRNQHGIQTVPSES